MTRPMKLGSCLCVGTEGVADRLERPHYLTRRARCQSVDSSGKDCWTRSGCSIVLPDLAPMGLLARPPGKWFRCMTSLALMMHRQLDPALARPASHPPSSRPAAPFVCHVLFVAAEEARSLPSHPHRASPKFHSKRHPSPCAVASELRPCQSGRRRAMCQDSASIRCSCWRGSCCCRLGWQGRAADWHRAAWRWRLSA